MEALPDDFLESLKKQFQDMKVNSSNIDEDAKEKVLSDSVSKIDEVLATLTKNSPDLLKLLSIKASIFYEKAKLSLINNLFDQSKEHLENSLNLILEYAADTQITFLYLRVVNYLSYVLSRLGNLERAKTLLENVLKDGVKGDPKVYSTEDLFSDTKTDEVLSKIKIDKLLINNMQMLGWIYGKMGIKDLYALMQHKCLQKELDINDGDPIQWAMKCCRLASLFLTECKWANARYHLTAAQVVLDPLEVDIARNPLIYKAQAELARVWVNYGLHLFTVSKKSSLERVIDEEGDSISIPKPPEVVDVQENCKFHDLEVNVPNIPATEIENNQDAKSLFAHTHKWLKRARLYYTLRDFPIQYVNIILELSELYRLLAFYENELESQYTLHKKRYETLENLSGILKEVRPNCYVAVSVELIREIIEVQIELMNLNLKKLYNPGDEANMNETDLKRRVDTLAKISAKMENLGQEKRVPYSENGELGATTNGIIDKETDVETNKLVKEIKGVGECPPADT